MRSLAVVLSLVGIPLLVPAQQHTDIKESVQQFVEYGDDQDAKGLGSVMHEKFRLVWNDTDNSQVHVMDKSTVLGFIERKEWGGSPRTIKVESVQSYDDRTAVAKVQLKGKAGTFNVFFSLLKVDGSWLVTEQLLSMHMNS
jgi:hypothetical protein